MRSLSSADRSALDDWIATGGWLHPGTLKALGPARPPPTPEGSGKGGLEGMLIAGVGPAGAAVFSNPFDVAKVRMQLQGEASSGGKAKNKVFCNVWECLYKTGHNEGIRGLQKGLSASIIREGSKNFFRIGLFHPVLDQLHDREVHSTSPPIWKRLVAGSVSGAAGAIICNPIEIVKTRLQASSLHPNAVGYQGHQYTGFVDAFRVISRGEGVAALWSGTGVSTVRSVLSTSVNMTVNTVLKESALEDPKWAWLGLTPGPLTDAVCSLASAFFAVAANNPADVVRTRLYNQPFEMVGGRRRGAYYDGAIDAFRKVLRDEGPAAFFKGFSGHFIRTGPHYVVAFMLMGGMERALVRYREARQERDWAKGVDLSFEAYKEGKVWTRSSVERALAAATAPLDSPGGGKEGARLKALSSDAEAIMRMAGDKGVFERSDYLTVVAPAIDGAVARWHARARGAP
uniref:ADP,ATP carrier protein n=1 Tax=Hemiselmis tepida TaxID=464990 RepID=A0A7S0YU59_9CRYP|mmetsp:Transcript_22141/g.55839  ORF Transcript_22141/g.55839 Transcript_22141/m.55839 type:complete len:458 (+) Transcript_22141:204-1577(+)